MSARLILPFAASSARVTHIAGVNINAAVTNNQVDWDASQFIGTSDFQMSSPSGITCLRDGFVKVDILVSYTTIVVRYNGRLKVSVNGASTSLVRGKNGFVRSASGNNEGSLFVSNIIPVTVGDVVGALVDRESLAGAATTDFRQGSMTIQYVEAS